MGLLKWIEHRTGIAALMHEALYERIPGGARWRYVWGSTLVFAFVVQAITGICLWMLYSPSSQSAWESVYAIQHEIPFGWLLRGVHHFMAQAMVVLLAIHLAQVVIDGAYRAPREFNFWIGLVLMKIVLGLSLTGYLLPWDQKGYWATRVATNLMTLAPVVGPDLQKLVVGGTDYGHYTLTRFFALHAGVLPALLVFFLVIHIALFRRHGITARQPLRRPTGVFWPDQVLRDAVACLAVLAVVLLLVFWPALRGAPMGEQPGEVLGAHLDAPADPAHQYAAARPEWYFLFLFQFLKFFEGPLEVVGAIYVPAAVMGVLFLMPLVGRWTWGHRLNVLLLFLLLAGVAGLTALAYFDDYAAIVYANPNGKALVDRLGLLGDEDHKARKLEASRQYLAAVEEARHAAERASVLVRGPGGIPAAGAVSLLRNDPLLVGPRLFTTHCASCHDHVDEHGRGIRSPSPSAPNLHGFGSRRWAAGLLNADPKHGIRSPAFFGNTRHKDGEMARVVSDYLGDPAVAREVEAVAAALSAEAGLRSQRQLDARDAALIAQGRQWISEKSWGDSERCVDCHRFHEEEGGGGAPDLTGWGSREWLMGMIARPDDPRFYGEGNDRMPAFAADMEHPELNRLGPQELALLVDWLRGEWYEPEGAAPLAAASPQPVEPPGPAAPPTKPAEPTATAASPGPQPAAPATTPAPAPTALPAPTADPKAAPAPPQPTAPMPPADKT